MKNKKLKIGLVGCGAIGSGISKFLEKEFSEKADLKYLYDIDPSNISKLKQKLKKFKPKIADSLKEITEKNDLIIETASWKAVSPLIKHAINLKKDLIILSVGGLLDNEKLLEKAQKRGVNIYMPSGAICGIDGILASTQGKLKKCVLTTSKPPAGLRNSDYIANKKINLNKIKKERLIFQGTPKQAFRYFPKNINVASTLLFASQHKNIKVQIKVSPKIKRNIHEIYLESNAGKINIKVENRPSKNNPKTSALTISSTQALITKLLSSVKIGT